MAAHLEIFQYSSSLDLHLSETTTRHGERNQHGSNRMQTRDVVEEDDSWEVRAFAEDTANVMGTTWPPRSYTCTYCRREFRSAQALGGHMNVHRRDRARLHQSATVPNPIKPSSPSPDFNFGGGNLCVLYQFPNPNNFNYNIIHSPSNSLFSFNNFIPSSPTTDHRAGSSSTFSRSSFRDNEQQQQPFSSSNGNNQELDLELRLGHAPNPTQNIISNLEAACLRKRSSD